MEVDVVVGDSVREEGFDAGDGEASDECVCAVWCSATASEAGEMVMGKSAETTCKTGLLWVVWVGGDLFEE